MHLRAEVRSEDVVERILARVSTEDRSDLERFLTNLRIIIKKARHEPLTEEERLYPRDSRISHFSRDAWTEEVAEFWEHRLGIVDHYEIADAQRVIDLLTSDWFLPPYPVQLRLNRRQVRILLELHRTPLLSANRLARRLGTTPRTAQKELRQLESRFNLRTVYQEDFQKFKLAHMIVYFRTRSVEHSRQLEQLHRRSRPLFLNVLVFDEDYQGGYIAYYVPDQPRGQRLFEARLSELREDYFETDYVDRIRGLSVSTSFDAYDFASGTWLLQSHTISEAALQFARTHDWAIPPAPTLVYGESIRFSQVDFLIAELSLVEARPARSGHIQEQLRMRGFTLAEKTIYARLQMLRQVGALWPFTYFEAPSFESFVSLYVRCEPGSRKAIGLMACVLPYAFVQQSDHGVTIHFQQAARCGSITGQLVRALSREEGVTHIAVVRRAGNLGGVSHVNAFDRWDEAHQRWLLQEGDI